MLGGRYDISWYYSDNYVAQGGDAKEVDFSLDDQVLAALAQSA